MTKHDEELQETLSEITPMYFLTRMWLETLPARVWEQGPNGWSSHPPTKEDNKRRLAFAGHTARKQLDGALA